MVNLRTMANLEEFVDFLKANPSRVYSAYDLSFLTFIFFRTQCNRIAKNREISKLINSLIKAELIAEKKYPGGNAFYLLPEEFIDPKQAVCAIDMFCYISHWSAMEYYGLAETTKPNALYITNPEPKAWSKIATRKIENDFAGFVEAFYENGLLRPRKCSPSKIGELDIVNTYTPQYENAFEYDGRTRVARIGRTFLDMIRCPSRCGGMFNVIDIYKQNADKFVEEIVTEVNEKANKIESVRAGYLLDEVCRIDHPLISEWYINVQRGGSRKLDPNATYCSKYSAKWCLSINCRG